MSVLGECLLLLSLTRRSTNLAEFVEMFVTNLPFSFADISFRMKGSRDSSKVWGQIWLVWRHPGECILRTPKRDQVQSLECS